MKIDDTICPKCLSEDTEFLDYNRWCKACDKPFEDSDSLRAQLQEARRQLAEKDKEIKRLTNPGRTQFCRMCQDYAGEVKQLKTKRLEPIDEAIARFESWIAAAESDDDEHYALTYSAVVTNLKNIRAKYQGDK